MKLTFHTSYSTTPKKEKEKERKKKNYSYSSKCVLRDGNCDLHDWYTGLSVDLFQYMYIFCCSVQKTYLRLLTIGLALARASAQLQDSNIPPAGRVAGGDTLSPSVL